MITKGISAGDVKTQAGYAASQKNVHYLAHNPLGTTGEFYNQVWDLSGIDTLRVSVDTGNTANTKLLLKVDGVTQINIDSPSNGLKSGSYDCSALTGEHTITLETVTDNITYVWLWGDE